MKQYNILKAIGKALSRTKEVCKGKGIHYVIRSGTKMVVKTIRDTFCFFYYKMFKSSRTFTFQGRT